MVGSAPFGCRYPVNPVFSCLLLSPSSASSARN